MYLHICTHVEPEGQMRGYESKKYRLSLVCSGDNCWLLSTQIWQRTHSVALAWFFRKTQDILKMCICRWNVFVGNVSFDSCLARYARDMLSEASASSCEESIIFIVLTKILEVSTGLIAAPESQISSKPSQRFSSWAFGAEAISDPVGFQSILKREE
jgi:hypothetical protein